MNPELRKPSLEFYYVENTVGDPAMWERHCHAHYEFIVVLEGDVQLIAEGSTSSIKAGMAILIPPLCYHTILGNRSKKYRRVVISFEQTFIPAVLQPYFQERELPVVPFSLSHKQTFEKISRKPDSEFYYPLTESLVIQVLYEALSHYQETSAHDENNHLKPAIDYIDDHLCEKIQLRDLAKLTFQSESSFCRLFTSAMKITPKQYILRKKLALAQKMIFSGMPATVVAAQCGWSNYSNFYRMYLKQFGIAPTRK